jgi:small nuclear ribonucleoprotein (snRNP)-like protein
MEVSRALQVPLDLLRLAIDAQVKVRLRSGETIIGTLKGYDMHMNLLLAQTGREHVEFIRGDMVVLVASDTHLY